MLVMFVLDELLINGVGLDALRPKPFGNVKNNKGQGVVEQTFVKATEQNRVGTAKSNPRYVDQHSLRRQASALDGLRIGCGT
jgi:hypothetical protein